MSEVREVEKSSTATEVERFAHLHRLQRRAAEALEGEAGVFDPADDQHRVAVLLLFGCGTAREASANTGIDRDFATSVIRRLRNSDLWPFDSTFGTSSCPGPCFDVLRAVQVGLGLAKCRAGLMGRDYELAPGGWKNVHGLLQKWCASSADRQRRTRDKNLVCFVSGELSWSRRGKGPRVGGSVVFRPEKGSVEPELGQRCALQLEDVVVWVRAESRLDGPTRFRMRLLGATDTRDAGTDALETLRHTVGRRRRLSTRGAPPADAAQWIAAWTQPPATALQQPH